MNHRGRGDTADKTDTDTIALRSVKPRTEFKKRDIAAIELLIRLSGKFFLAEMILAESGCTVIIDQQQFAEIGKIVQLVPAILPNRRNRAVGRSDAEIKETSAVPELELRQRYGSFRDPHITGKAVAALPALTFSGVVAADTAALPDILDIESRINDVSRQQFNSGGP